MTLKQFKEGVMAEYIYVKRERKGGKKHHQNQGNNGYTSQSKTPRPQAQENNFLPCYNAEQVNGEFSFDTIHGLKLKEVEYYIPNKDERKKLRSQFNKKRTEFLQYLATEKRDMLIERLGLSDAEIERMKEGKSINGYNVHHMHPIALGGKNEFSNFILTPLCPHDQWHHDVMDPQVDPRGVGYDQLQGKHGTFKIPYSDEMIYDPKKYGFTRDGKEVEPNYTIHDDLSSKPQNYTVEQVAKRNKENGRTVKADPALAKAMRARMAAGR